MIFSDQIQRKINIPIPPRRIISLVPSITELLFDLGLNEQIIGVTRFCIFPTTARKEKKVIGGTKNLKLDRIRALKPDLIIADKEENTKSQIEELAKEFPIWISNIRRFDDAIDMIEKVGELTRTSTLAQKLVTDIQDAFATLVPLGKEISVAYFIWQKPLMVAGADTFIHEMIKKMRLTNAFAHQSRYPEVTEAVLQKNPPDLVFLSSEPYPFAKKHIQYFQEMVPNAKILLVDGTFFSWYGSRMKRAPAYFQQLIDSDIGIVD